MREPVAPAADQVELGLRMDASGQSQTAWIGEEDLTDLTMTVNGVEFVARVLPRETLADAVRSIGLTGTRLGCEHGVCGACTVIVDGAAVRSCLMLALQAEGRAVETVEGLAGEELSPLQQAFHDHRALQCGFCTSGFLMLAEAHLRAEPDASAARTREVMASNLCRCTGYAGIVGATCATQAAAREAGR
jgi:carbon-monoxide dehydrogenase small subunit